MLKVLLSRPDIGAVGPLTNICRYGFQQGIQVNADVTNIASIWQLTHNVEQMGFESEPFFFLEDFCLLLRRKAAEAVGDFDERFFPMGFEDADMASGSAGPGTPCSALAPTSIPVEEVTWRGGQVHGKETRGFSMKNGASFPSIHSWFAWTYCSISTKTERISPFWMWAAPAVLTSCG